MNVRTLFGDPFAAIVVAAAVLAPLLPFGAAQLLANAPVPPLFATAADRAREPILWHAAFALFTYIAVLMAPLSVVALLRTRRPVPPARVMLLTLGLFLLAVVLGVLAIRVSPTAPLPKFGFMLTSRPGLALLLLGFSAFYYLLVYGLLGVIGALAPRAVAAP